MCCMFIIQILSNMFLYTLFYLILIAMLRLLQSSSVQLLSHVWPFATPWIAACQASLSITNSWSLLKLNAEILLLLFQIFK